jgi:hypothetical protein
LLYTVETAPTTSTEKITITMKHSTASTTPAIPALQRIASVIASAPEGTPLADKIGIASDSLKLTGKIPNNPAPGVFAEGLNSDILAAVLDSANPIASLSTVQKLYGIPLYELRRTAIALLQEIGLSRPEAEIHLGHVPLEAVIDSLRAMALEGLPASQVQVNLIRLAQDSGHPAHTLRAIYKDLKEECDRPLPDRATFDELAAATKDHYDIAPLLRTLAPVVDQYARAYNQNAVAFTVPLLATAASLLNPATRLVIGGPTDYQVPPIFWGGLEAEPGSIKSPIFKMALRPLHLLQATANDAYTEALNQYKRDLRATAKDEEEPTPPTYRHYYHDSATVEAIQRTATEQRDHGTVVAPDELSALFNSFDQYKGGKGSDRDFWKSAADGAAVKIDRASSETRFVAQTSISVTGTIQPEALRSQMAGGDRDGFWSRFMWVRLPLRRLPAPGNAPKIDITSWLYSTYQRLEAMPAQQFRFTPDGQRMWDRWHEWVEDRRLETETPVERVLYPKYRDRAARVALIAHCLEYASQNKPVPAEIPTSTLEAAIAFAQYCLNQTRLLYADIGMSDTLTGDLLRVWEWSQQQQAKGRAIVQPGDLQRSKRVKQGNGYAKTPYCRELLGQLVELGYLTEIDGGFGIAERVETPPSPQEIEKIEPELKKVESVFNSQNPLPDSVSADTPPKVEKLKDAPTSPLTDEAIGIDDLMELVDQATEAISDGPPAIAVFLEVLGTLTQPQKTAFWRYLRHHAPQVKRALVEAAAAKGAA